VVAEVILPDSHFFDLIRAGDKTGAVSYWLSDLGGKTLLDHAIEKIAAGLVDPRMAEKTVGHLNAGIPVYRRLNMVEIANAG
jgi:hypothetical protein